jgi:hypothetical protein
MDNWDETKLNEVAEKKHGETDRQRPNQTEIVSCLHIYVGDQFVFLSRSVNTLSKRSKTANTVGFGNVKMDRNVSIDMHCHPDLFSKRIGKSWKKWKKAIRSVWKS